MPEKLQQITEIDRALVAAAQGIKVLSRLSWPAQLCQDFLQSWRNGRPILPDIKHQPLLLTNEIEALEAVRKKASGKNPLERYLHNTASSYVTAAQMLGAVGTKDFVKYSADLYGRPDDQIGSEYVSHLDAAEHFIEVTDAFIKQSKIENSNSVLTPQSVADDLTAQTKAFFHSHNVQVVVDPDLSSKAVAGAGRIRIRAFTSYAPIEVKQLMQHEAFVHTVTAINGREQPNLKSLGLGAPRTTKTQEGMATLAELVSLTMEVSRLRRLALRTKAVHIALEGANFIDVFRLFLGSGQSESESFYSAMRVFRGGDVRGGVAFTKDIVYLQGLINIHAFARHAIHENQIEQLRYLFSGRLDVNDISELLPYFQSHFIAAPMYLPPWIENVECLAAHFSYQNFAHELDFSSVYKKKPKGAKPTG